MLKRGRPSSKFLCRPSIFWDKICRPSIFSDKNLSPVHFFGQKFVAFPVFRTKNCRPSIFFDKNLLPVQFFPKKLSPVLSCCKFVARPVLDPSVIYDPHCIMKCDVYIMWFQNVPSFDRFLRVLFFCSVVHFVLLLFGQKFSFPFFFLRHSNILVLDKQSPHLQKHPLKTKMWFFCKKIFWKN